MLDKAVRHLLQGQTGVFQADFLADHIERHGREAVVHCPHHARQHGAVADAGIEQPNRRRTRVDIDQLLPNPVGHNPLLAAGVHKQQVFLTVIEKAKIALRILRRRLRREMLRGLARGPDEGGAWNRGRSWKSTDSASWKPSCSPVWSNQRLWPRAAMIGPQETGV